MNNIFRTINSIGVNLAAIALLAFLLAALSVALPFFLSTLCP